MADRRYRGFSLRVPTAWFAVFLITFAVVAGSVGTARSQVAVYPDGLPDGNYSGGIYLHVGTAKLDLDGAGALTTSTDVEGDARITMDSDEPSLSGVWAMEGTGDIGGTFSLNGASGTASGSLLNVANGTFSGTPLDGRVVGTMSSEGSRKVDTEGSQTSTRIGGGPNCMPGPWLPT